MNGYDLSRTWFDFCFENPEKIKPNHTALYFFCIEHCNRLGWKKKFGLPTIMAKEAIGIKSYNTYINTLNEIIDWGFIEIVERSKNQYSANIIALSNFNKALDKALDKALIKHASKQGESTSESVDSIDKQLNKEQLNKQTKPLAFSFMKSLINLGAEKNLVTDWLKVRKTKKLTNTETAFNSLKKEIDKSDKDINQILKTCCENSWGGFKSSWNSKDQTNSNPKPTFHTNR